MQYTLLQLVQAIASSMDSDEITSINDSTESLQIATVVRTAFYDIISRTSIPENMSPFNLTASGDSTKPVLMTLPTNVIKLVFLKYNKRQLVDTFPLWEDVCYLPFKEFLDYTYRYNTSNSDVGSFTHTVNGATITFLYKNSVAPLYYTTFDDSTVVFDSYDVDVDQTLDSTKTLGYGLLKIDWTMSDSFVPPLDEPQHELLLNEAKSLAWAELKQTNHAKAEASARRQWIKTQSSKIAFRDFKDLDQLINFGRK